MTTELTDIVSSKHPGPQRQFPDEVREYYRTLLRRLDWPGSGSQRLLQTLGITSCYGGEGVSTVACQLAATAAACDGRRVILVDGNLVSPAVHRTFGLGRGPGLADVVVQGREIADCIRASGVENLWVLTGGTPPRDPAGVYDSADLPRFIETVREHFDLAVFDLPAVGEASSAMRIAGLLDGMLVVVESERVRREVAQRMTEQLTEANARLIGAVLNKRQQHVPNWLYRTL